MSVISTSSTSPGSNASTGSHTSKAGASSAASTPEGHKAAVLKELLIWRGVDLRKIDLPPLPMEPREKLSMSDAWDCDNQAVRQLVNIPRHKARPTQFKEGYGGPQVRVKSAPSTREKLQEKVGSGVYRRKTSTDSESYHGRAQPHVLPTIDIENPFKPQGKYYKYTVDYYMKKNRILGNVD